MCDTPIACITGCVSSLRIVVVVVVDVLTLTRIVRYRSATPLATTVSVLYMPRASLEDKKCISRFHFVVVSRYHYIVHNVSGGAFKNMCW